MGTERLSHLALSDNGFLFDTSTGYTYTLNATGTFILKRLMDDQSEAAILQDLMEEFDTVEEVASRDLEQFVSYLSELGLVQTRERG
jgi:PqqD family protein of HPr-rel-A system